MNEAAGALLNKLFDRWQARAPGAVRRTVSLKIDGRDGAPYFATSGAARESLHAVLLNAERTGAVTLEWGKFEASHELRRIVLIDGHALAMCVGRLLASDETAALANLLHPLMEPERFGWIREAFDGACQDWARGKTAFRLAVPAGNVQIISLFKGLIAVADGLHRGLDMRTFSARFLGDSKAMERLKYSFADVWTCHSGKRYRHPDDLFTELELQKVPHPVLLRGPLQAAGPAGQVDLSFCRPYIGLPAEVLSSVAPLRTPSYVLTVENLVNFYRHCREIDDDGLIIFASGFPGPKLLDFIAALDNALPAITPFFHWGDCDVRGAEILYLIDRACDRHLVRPHQMDVVQSATEMPDPIFSSAERVVLEKMAASRRPVSTLALGLLQFGVPEEFEQEHRDPVSPITF